MPRKIQQVSSHVSDQGHIFEQLMRSQTENTASEARFAQEENTHCCHEHVEHTAGVAELRFSNVE